MPNEGHDHARLFWVLQALEEHVTAEHLSAQIAERAVRNLPGFEPEKAMIRARAEQAEKDLDRLRRGIDPRNGTWRNGTDALAHTVKDVASRYRSVAEAAWHDFPGLERGR